MNKILIIGASGFLGKKLHTYFKDKYTVIGTYQTKAQTGLINLNITDTDQVYSFFEQHHPDIVIHTASMSSPDACEDQKDLAKTINHLGTKHVVDACCKIGAKLIYASTSHVFDGEKNAYSENDELKPINYYGETKKRAEEEVKALDDSVILRFDILYGYNDPTDVKGFASSILSGKDIFLDDHRLRQPLFVDDVCDAIQVIIDKKYSGTFHLGGEEQMSTYAFGVVLEELIRETPSCIKKSENQSAKAKRPTRIFLDTAKSRHAGIPFHSFSEAAQIIKKQIE